MTVHYYENKTNSLHVGIASSALLLSKNTYKSNTTLHSVLQRIFHCIKCKTVNFNLSVIMKIKLPSLFVLFIQIAPPILSVSNVIDITIVGYF